MSKHTPGPWEWQRPFSRNLAKCLSGGGRPLLRCIDVSDANANLIAAAPMMYEALKQIEPILTRMYGPQAAELPPMQIVRAAIAKAEGA